MAADQVDLFYTQKTLYSFKWSGELYFLVLKKAIQW